MKGIIAKIQITVCLLFGMLITLTGQEQQKLSTNGMEITHTKRIIKNEIPLKNAACPDSEYRTIDGTCNNTSSGDKEDWGATDVSLLRTMLPQYGSTDHYDAMGGESRPSPRLISNNLLAQDSETPSPRGLSSFVFTWGQFLDHDISLTPEGHTEYEPITLPADEALFTSDIPFFRSEVYSGTGNGTYRQQINLITSYIDGSNVYGSETERANWLRTFQNGKLKSSEGNLLPYNTLTGEYDDEIDPDAPSMAGDGSGTVKTFVAGDVRAAEQPGLTSLHTLFVRLHNNTCDRLRNQGISGDEEIYQKARKEVGAIIQSITYNEFLPALGVRLSRPRGYNDRVKSDISNLFATAAYRLGHTMVTDELLLRDDNCNGVDAGAVSLLDGFFNPEVVEQYNIEPFLKGLSIQIQNEVDLLIIDNLRNFLFGDPSSGNAFGLDLASLNIQRGRDHGLPDYNSVRRHYTGRSARNFRDITRNNTLRRALEETYDNINNIDAWVGLLAEDKERGSSLGRTLRSMLKKQFENLRDGDRYFYQHDRFLNPQDRRRIDNTRLSDIIRRNTQIKNIQRNVFIAESCQNSNNKNLNLDTRENKLDGVLELEIYPNPSSDIVNIRVSNVSNSEGFIRVTDIKGSVINEFKIYESSYSLDVKDLLPGMYTIALTQIIS